MLGWRQDLRAAVRHALKATRMALTATIYSLDTELADIDRAVYEKFGVRMAVTRFPEVTGDTAK